MSTSQQLQSAQAGQPAPASPEVTPSQQTPVVEPQNGAQPKYITYEEAQRLAETAAETALRKAQSHNDKTVQRIESKIAQLQNAGVTVTPEQAAKLVQAEDAQQQQQSPSQPSPARPAQAQPKESGEAHPVLQVAAAMMEEAGIQIEETDPEFATIDLKTTSPRQFLKTVEAAIEAKQQRLQSAGSPARMPTLAGGGSGAGGKEAILQELDRLNQHPTLQNKARRAELRNQLNQYQR